MPVHRLAFVITDMSGGGAARVASILCRQWASAGHDVHLITFEESGTKSAYPLGGEVARHQIGAVRSGKDSIGFIANNALRVLRLRKILRQLRPTTVIAFLIEANVATVLASAGLRIPVLISERNHPGHHQIAPARALMRKLIYPLADRLCVQTDDIRRWFTSQLGIDASIIPNPVETPEMPADVDQLPTKSLRRKALCMGRLDPQKGFDRVIDAFAEIRDRVADWDLVIIGEGDTRPLLEAQIARHQLIDRVWLPGATAHPELEMHAADLFIHPARYEGYPNVIVEALAAGRCIVATDCPGATGEILQGGLYGLLVPDRDAAALENAMLLAMTDDHLRASYSIRAQEAVRALTPVAIAARWIALVEAHRLPDAATGKGGTSGP